jgi:hypothetical protein
MRQEERVSISVIADQVREYLCANPKATDTLEGIAGWWLSPAQGNADLEAIQQAIDLLVARREMVRILSADGQVFYARGLL